MVAGAHSDLAWMRHDAAGDSPQLPLVALLAISLAVGIAIAWNWPAIVEGRAWPWLIASATLLLLAGVALAAGRRRLASAPPRPLTTRFAQAICITLMAFAITAFGVAWIGIRHHHTAADNLAAHLGEDAALVKIRGVALAAPTVRAAVGGSLARFNYREPATYFPVRVRALVDSNGQEHPFRGEVLVRIDQTIMPFRAGDQVEATGFLLRPPPPRNPGEFDFRQLARSLGQAGILTVRQRDLLIITPADRTSVYERILQWRDELRRRAGAWLLSDLPATQQPQRDALLASIMLGLRDEHVDGVYDSFQRVGLAHVLAISGFHLGVLAGFVLLIAKGLGGGRFTQGLSVIVFVGLYLLIVEARMPVMRAGMMTMMACAGLMIGRRINVAGLVWLSGFALLLWRPDQLFDPGFQLTFGIVIALLHWTGSVERRLPLRPRRDSGSGFSMLWRWTRTAAATAITAWIIALPIVIHHFGLISPLAAALSVITLPLASIILAIGFLKMALAAVLPSIALALGVPLAIAADVLLSVVLTFDAMPLTVLHVPVPPAWWTSAAALCCIWVLTGDRWLHRLRQWRPARRTPTTQPALAAPLPTALAPPRQRRVGALKWIAAAVLAAILFVPSRPIEGVRIDMLSVGDGSCYVIRSHKSTVLFDAGSSTDLNVARKSIIPALRHLGVRAIDALIISHADMDHYSAVLEIVDEFEIREALMTPQLFAEAQADPLGPVSFMLDHLSARRVVVRAAVAGDRREFGATRWTWLHPQPQRGHRRSNDDSTVVRIECSQRAILMCGDVQADAMKHLLRQAASADITLAADVIELPHHGSFHETAVAFIEHVKPNVVMQSTGWTRWRQDRWHEALAGMTRLVTARDGACTVHIQPDGDIRTHKFLHQTTRH